MLRITQSKSASGAKKYYCEQYYKEGHSSTLNYYSEQSHAIGRWGGKAAHMLKLEGDILQSDFAKLCDNINPLTGKTLTVRNDKDRTVVYDFTFSATKSVSLLYAFGSAEEKEIVLNAFQQSVRETMADVEQDMQARVRANGKNENRVTGNIAYGEFTHFTTRPIDGVSDPHLHIHCTVFNATFDHDEQKWKAGQFQSLKRDAPYYEAMFQSRLAHQLQRAGYAVERTDHGFELVGIDKHTIRKFSRRTEEIEAYAEEHNISDVEKKARIGGKTRESKRLEVNAEQQEIAWFNRLTEEEWQRFRQLRQTTAFPLQKSDAADKALQFSLSHHLERKSVASDKEILATAIKSSIGQATPEQVQRAFAANEDILTAEQDLRQFITTKEALQEEKRLIIRATQTRNKFRPINEHYEPQNEQLNDEQRAAVKHALSSTDGIITIKGKAGTGKTTLMKAVKSGILENERQIFSFAPSSEASRGVQRSEGFENADTVAMLILDKKRHAALKHQVIWIDEAGMLSNKDMNKILAIAEAQSARVILSGDTSQHSSIERGDALRILEKEAGIKPITVSKIQRQKNADYKEAVKMLSGGAPEKGFRKLDSIGAIQEIEDSNERVDAVAEDYYRSAYRSSSKAPVKEVLVVSPTHAEGNVVTERIRQKLKEHQVIGEHEREYTVLKNKQLTEAEKQQQESYQPGNVLVFFQNAKGIQAGKKLEVAEVGDSAISARDTNGSSYTVLYSAAHKFTVFEPRQVQVAEGDKIRITANGKSTDGKHLFNGSTFSIEGFDKQGNIKLSNDSTISKDFGHFNLGYVMTSHSSQGKTADKVIISQSSGTFRASSMEQFYVSVSRGREAVSIYTDDKVHLQQAVAQSGQRTSATELMAKRQKQTEEINRVATQKRSQERTNEHYNHLTSKTKDDGLQDQARTR